MYLRTFAGSLKTLLGFSASRLRRLRQLYIVSACKQRILILGVDSDNTTPQLQRQIYFKIETCAFSEFSQFVHFLPLSQQQSCFLKEFIFSTALWYRNVTNTIEHYILLAEKNCNLILAKTRPEVPVSSDINFVVLI